MTKNDREVLIYLVFLSEFVDEGHFDDYTEVIKEKTQNLRRSYAHLTIRTMKEKQSLASGIDGLAKDLIGRETTPDMMLIFLMDITAKYEDYTTGPRYVAWKALRETILNSKLYQELINKVPDKDDLSIADKAVLLNERFQLYIKKVEAEFRSR